jgi:hypothetical protein
MATTSKGYAGKIQTPDYARLSLEWGVAYGVRGFADWLPGVTTAVARGVTVGIGVGYGRGVEDTVDAPVTLSADAVATGTRYDTLVAHRDWPNSLTTFKLVKGPTALGIAADLEHIPGVRDDHPIAIYAISGTTATMVADLRTWHGSGGMIATNDLVLQFLNDPGTRVVIGTTEYAYEPGPGQVGVWVARDARPLSASRPRVYSASRGGSDSWAGWGNMIGLTLPNDAPTGLYRVIGMAFIGFNASSLSQAWAVTKRFVGATDAIPLGGTWRDDHTGGLSFGVDWDHDFTFSAGQRINYQIHSPVQTTVFAARIAATFLG